MSSTQEAQDVHLFILNYVRSACLIGYLFSLRILGDFFNTLSMGLK